MSREKAKSAAALPPPLFHALAERRPATLEAEPEEPELVEDLSMRPAGEQAVALAAGAVTARGLLEACLQRIERENPTIGAFWHVDDGGARAAADRSDGRRRAGRALSPFDGLTLCIKDNIDVAGLPCTAGLAAFRARIATKDAPVVTAARAAGLVILGKTAMDEGALGATGQAPGFPPCQNPLRPGFTPGGSSSGSAAAIAAGFGALAIGSDTMGSVRIPAACCGVSGLKPTAGLIPRTGVLPLSTTLDCVGMVARDARDAAALLALLAGFDREDALSVAAPADWRARLESPSATGWSGQRVGVLNRDAFTALEPAVGEAFDAACAALASAGVSLTPIDIPDWRPPETRRAALLLSEAEASVTHAALVDDDAAASEAYRAALAFGRQASAGKLVTALEILRRSKAGVMSALSKVDAIILPTEPFRAFPHGQGAGAQQGDFTTLASIAGLPALAVPWPAPDGGLPASIQFVAGPYEEARLVALAGMLVP